MQIKIKLKFLQNPNQNPIQQIINHHKEQTKHLHKSKQKKNQANQTIKNQNPLYNLQSHRSNKQKTIQHNPTPKQNLTHRYSKSKQIKNIQKIKQQQISKSLHKTKKQLHRNHIEKNISFILEKGIQLKSNKKSEQKKKNILQQEFTGKFNGVQGKKILKNYSEYLNELEKTEIINQKSIYYICPKLKKSNKLNNEYSQQQNYRWQKNDQIAYRYELLQKLGSGSFGQVIKAYDHKGKQYVAIKIIKSKKQYFQLALNEINILMLLKQKDNGQDNNCVKIKDFIVFRKHMCIIFEILSISIYDLLKLNQFEGIQIQFIRRFAIQIFNALSFLKKNKIIHSDIKPQNILLKSKSKTGIKLIDFGTSLFQNQASYQYIQSRYYRAPQVILGYPYSYPIDVWSVGCVITQLYTGLPLFSGQNQQQQLRLIIQIIGFPPIQYLKNCRKCFYFFNQDYILKSIQSRGPKTQRITDSSLSNKIKDKQFLKFLQKIFVWDPDQRISPLQALIHPWILHGLPQDIKQQHLLYIIQQLKCEGKKKKQSKETPKKRIKRNSQLYGQYRVDQKNTRRRSGSLC